MTASVEQLALQAGAVEHTSLVGRRFIFSEKDLARFAEAIRRQSAPPDLVPRPPVSLRPDDRKRDKRDE